MILRHATPRANLPGILAQGLLPDKAVGKRRATWLHTSGKTAWALLHTQTRKGVALQDIIVLEIRVPRSWLRRYQTGLWSCERVINPERITQITEATAYAASPVQE